MRTASQWLDEYGESHRNPVNKVLHWICVPVIVWCVLGFLWLLPVPFASPPRAVFDNWAALIVAGVVIYYAVLSIRLAVGALILLMTFLWSIDRVQHLALVPLWGVCTVLFLAAWIGQFVGHAIEGKRPSFLKDVEFLMIGPLWLLAALYERLGIAGRRR
ncbi:MAG TPA: Mpo1-like protein [Steroidobacteraceae bacterium]|jgi:uncharacterized membrane protein YGL010W|nr:Mpo1-like protein [Steroidobacteraceae bacterium]